MDVQVLTGLPWEFSHTFCLALVRLTHWLEVGSLPARTKGVALWQAKGAPTCVLGQCHSALSTQSPGAMLHYPERTGLTQRREQSVTPGTIFLIW